MIYRVEVTNKDNESNDLLEKILSLAKEFWINRLHLYIEKVIEHSSRVGNIKFVADKDVFNFIDTTGTGTDIFGTNYQLILI